MNHSSSSFGSVLIVVPGVLIGWGVSGPAGEPAFTAVENGLEAGMDDVPESDEPRILEAGSKQSRGLYGQFKETVVVNGMKKASNGTCACAVIKRSRNLGLYTR